MLIRLKKPWKNKKGFVSQIQTKLWSCPSASMEKLGLQWRSHQGRQGFSLD